MSRTTSVFTAIRRRTLLFLLAAVIVASVNSIAPSPSASAACYQNQGYLFEILRYDNLVLVEARPAECAFYRPLRRVDGTDNLVNQGVWRGPH